LRGKHAGEKKRYHVARIAGVGEKTMKGEIKPLPKSCHGRGEKKRGDTPKPNCEAV